MTRLSLSTLALTSALALGAAATATTPADAANGRHRALIGGAAAGVVGGALLGGALNRDRGYEEDAPTYVRTCHFERERYYDGYDYQVRRVRVCD